MWARRSYHRGEYGAQRLGGRLGDPRHPECPQRIVPGATSLSARPLLSLSDRGQCGSGLLWHGGGVRTGISRHGHRKPVAPLRCQPTARNPPPPAARTWCRPVLRSPLPPAQPGARERKNATGIHLDERVRQAMASPPIAARSTAVSSSGCAAGLAACKAVSLADITLILESNEPECDILHPKSLLLP